MKENSMPAKRSALDVAAHPHGHPAFDRFVATIAALRAPGGCPWDAEQTHESIARNMIEEAYEAVDAIEERDTAHLREELGDVLLQVVLQSQIAADAGEFSIDEVCADIDAKMVRRHPHVFGDASAADAGEVLGLWERVKLAEQRDARNGGDDAGGEGGHAPGLLDGVPTGLPALMQAQKISRKAAAAGFEWDTLEDVWDKVREEAGELREAYAAAPRGADGMLVRDAEADAKAGAGGRAAAEMELGDLLFTIVNVARRMGLDAESALRASCGKFRRRWAYMEQAGRDAGEAVEDMDPERREALWAQAKSRE